MRTEILMHPQGRHLGGTVRGTGQHCSLYGKPPFGAVYFCLGFIDVYAKEHARSLAVPYIFYFRMQSLTVGNGGHTLAQAMVGHA